MTHDQNDMPLTECLLFNSGIINCVPAVKYISKCEPDYSYWPYDKHKCRILLGSWSYTGEEIDFQLGGKGVMRICFAGMDSCTRDSILLIRHFYNWPHTL